jgi:hypothetical protein
VPLSRTGHGSRERTPGRAAGTADAVGSSTAAEVIEAWQDWPPENGHASAAATDGRKLVKWSPPRAGYDTTPVKFGSNGRSSGNQ